MQAFPHHYAVSATQEDDKVTLESPGLPSISSGAPAEFGGPGNLWSPETLFAASVADCFILSFKAIAAASKFSYSHISCDVEAILDRVDRVTRFTEIIIKPVLTVGDNELQSIAEKLLHKAETTCLITNSVNATLEFQPVIRVDGD